MLAASNMSGTLDPENWMSHLDPLVRVIDTYIPGSHDASAYMIGDKDADLRNDMAGSITQCGSYTAQCNAGIRYFDMRCQWHDSGAVYMHHADYYFQFFKDVLKQLDNFSKNHPGEFLFLDIDFNDDNLAPLVKDILIQTLGEDRFATCHYHIPISCGVDGPVFTYPTQLTWGALREHNKPFLILWCKKNSGVPWAPHAGSLRHDEYDDFDKKTSDQILSFLDKKLGEWSKDKLFATQLINTPLASPIGSPAELDLHANRRFHDWVTSHKPGAKLGIVKMDFVNAPYKRDTIEYIIRLNTFTTPPNLPPLTDPIYYTDKIRLKTMDNRYVCLDVKQAPDLCKLTLVKEPNDNCNFMIRDYDYHPRKPFWYSGNLDADTIDCHGNFRMVHFDTRPVNNVGNDYVLSVDSNQGGLVYWGVHWGPSDRHETFCLFDPNNLGNSGQVYHGSRVMVLAMLHASNNDFAKFFNTFGENFVRAIPVAGRGLANAIAKSPDQRKFWMIGQDDTGAPRVYAASPGTMLAESFVIEKVL
ncbi:PLC-like phosphodiesterase [Gaertneriomyces semiglobifer]|nr:PLC-like phosphodiesterase [Gaertneriomyces semiglobifer]